jgi:hypothetical protein
MLNTFDSFNVSVATGIILYETTRQRLQWVVSGEWWVVSGEWWVVNIE